ncbi:MAG: hypothetical protein JWQ68_842, partial [Cryobacterium sp.]|nr:hypothetical protein [Cryobacterium sp.]
ALAGAEAPGALAVVVSLAFAGIISIGLTGRVPSLWRIACAVLASQMIFHGLFSLGAPGGRLASAVHSAGPIHGQVTVTLSDPVTPMHSATSHGAVMLVSHLVAALVTIAAIRYGDTAYGAILTAARLAVLRLFDPMVRVSASRSQPYRVPAGQWAVPHDLRRIISSMRHRGPPVSWNFV